MYGASRTRFANGFTMGECVHWRLSDHTVRRPTHAQFTQLTPHHSHFNNMAFRAVTGELKTGRYQIQNVQTGQFLELPTSDDNEPVINALQHPAEKQKWDVFECGAGTYKLKNWGQGLWANVARKPQLGSAVICKLAEKQFVIEESRTPGQYRIFMDETELYWILSSGNLGSSITLGRQGDNRNLWSFWTTSRP